MFSLHTPWKHWKTFDLVGFKVGTRVRNELIAANFEQPRKAIKIAKYMCCHAIIVEIYCVPKNC